MPGMLEVAHRLMEQDIARCGIMQPYEVGTQDVASQALQRRGCAPNREITCVLRQ